jgi:hypothetical protein
MDIELTSSREDGTFTWRAAGAKQPKGTVPESLVGAGRHVGDVLRVEADFDIDGITIISVLPSKEKGPDPDRIEIVAPRAAAPGVTTTLVQRSERRGRDRRGFDGEGDGDRDRRPRRSENNRRAASGAGAGATASSTERGAPPRGERAQRPRTERSDRPSSPRAERPARPRPQAGAERAAASEARPARTRPPRLAPKTEHRDAYLASLAPEQRLIAEQLASGGMPALRRAIAEEEASAKAAGRPPLNSEAIIAVAEQLLTPVREATWLDRAEAAVGSLDHITVRDLRASVAGAAPRDDHGREILNTLRSALDERLTKLRTAWEHEIVHALEEKRVLHALRLSARPPDQSARLPATLVGPLAEAASAALAPSVQVERWLALLEAALATPVRRSIKPVGLPEDPSGAVRQAAAAAAGRIPALSKLLGLAMPPPPRPLPRALQAAAQRPVRDFDEPVETTSSESDDAPARPIDAPESAPDDNAGAPSGLEEGSNQATNDDARSEEARSITPPETVVEEPAEQSSDVQSSGSVIPEDAMRDEPVEEPVTQLE